MSATSSSTNRDPRVDLLRGLSLLSIFVDHIPQNRLADYTLHNLGFSDAAELFVILAGFSATMAYGRIFERDGVRTGLAKLLSRCLQIYGVQVVLLLSTLLFVSQWTRLYGTESLILGPMLRDGLHGTMRGLSLRALPIYLDILPLYILLLAGFPLIWFGMSRSLGATVCLSVIVYAAANVWHWDLPNVVDRSAVGQWYFNPFTWQLIFVMGCWFALATQRRFPIMVQPRSWLRVVCWTYLLFALISLDAWKLWPAPFGAGFPGLGPPFALFGNEPKSFVTPWRLAHILALTYLALTSGTFERSARSLVAAPIAACGRKSLQVFAVGCILALIGRLVFKTVGVTLPTEILVNGIGLGLMLATGVLINHRAKPSRPANRGVRPLPDSAHPCSTSFDLTADHRGKGGAGKPSTAPV